MKSHYIILLIFLIALSVRLIFFLIYPDQKLPDSLTYELLGYKFFEPNFEGPDPVYIFQSDGHMPLYSILCYLLGGRINLIILDIFISSLSILPIYFLSKQLFNDRYIGFLSALIFSLYPFSIFYSLSGMTETIFVFLIISFFYFLYKDKLFLSSILLVISIYLRPSIEMFYPLIIFSFFLFVKKNNLISCFLKVSIYICVYVVLMLPWWIHNYIKYDTFVRTNLAMGEILYIGNNPLNKSGGGISDVDFSLKDFEHEDGKSLYSDPIVRDNVLKNAAIQFILNNPENFIKLSIIKFKRFWQLYPYAEEYSSSFYKFVSIITLLPLYILSILFIFSNRHLLYFFTPIILFILLLNFVHTISISSIRYRFPIEPFLIIFSSSYIFYKFNRLKLYFTKYFENT